jgi:hypothetical protein
MRWWVVALAAVAASAWAHGVHASLASIDYNTQTKSFEIVIVATADDVETLLRRDTGKQIELDRTPGAEQLVFEYIKKNLALRAASGEELPLAWVGMEVRTAKLTVYVEAKASTGVPNGMRIRDDLLFDLLPDQVNMLSVNRDHKGKSSDHLFQANAIGNWQTIIIQ